MSTEHVGGGLEQVREILFGASQRDFEQRLVRNDTHVAARVDDLEQETRRRTDVLEAHLRKELGAQGARIERQIAEANDGLRNLARDQHEGAAQLEKRIARVEEASANELRELRQQLLEQAKSFLDELQDLRKETLATIQRELGLAEGEVSEARGEAERGARH